MSYLFVEILLCLAAAALLGLLAGWLLWGRREDHSEALGAANAKLATLDAELTPLRAQLAAAEADAETLVSLKGNLDDCRRQVHEQEALIAALKVREQTNPTLAVRLDYESYKSDRDGQYYFRFLMPDGKVVLRSEGYTRNAGCENGLRSVMKNATDPDRIERKTSKDGRYFFDIVARNYEIVGTSTLFKTEADREAVISLFAMGETVLNRLGDATQTVATSLPPPPVKEVEPDDLKKIYGIGPLLEKLLNGQGVFRYEQIAKWTRDDISRFSDALEQFKGRVERDDWIAGARRAYKEKYGKKFE